MKKRIRRGFSVWLLAGSVLLPLVMASGCGQQQGQGIVKGKVLAFNPKTRKLQPLVCGHVIFFNEEKGMQIAAPIGPDGTYLATGVFEGTNKVAVSSFKPDEGEDASKSSDAEDGVRPDPKKWIAIPEFVGDITQTPLGLTVSKGEQAYDIDLSKIKAPDESTGE